MDGIGTEYYLRSFRMTPFPASGWLREVPTLRSSLSGPFPSGAPETGKQDRRAMNRMAGGARRAKGHMAEEHGHEAEFGVEQRQADSRRSCIRMPVPSYSDMTLALHPKLHPFSFNSLLKAWVSNCAPMTTNMPPGRFPWRFGYLQPDSFQLGVANLSRIIRPPPVLPAEEIICIILSEYQVSQSAALVHNTYTAAGIAAQ